MLFSEIAKLLYYSFNITIILLLTIFAIVSITEKEPKASLKAIIVIIGFSLINTFAFISIKNISLYIIFDAVIIIGVLILFIPFKKIKIFNQTPLKIDERDTMFSRNELVPNTDKFNHYYKQNPDKLKLDNRFREKAGLLSPDSNKYNELCFAAAEANFFTIEQLKFSVDYKNVAKKKSNISDTDLKTFIKKWLKQTGAHSVGVTKLKNHHLYTKRGRTFNYGKDVDLNHKYAIAIIVEMDKEMTDTAPDAPTIMESSQQYLNSGVLAVKLAQFIRNIGFEAKAHIDGNYDVVCPLVAKDAGLGEIGRMGLLMTPDLGPRVRISVVTTNLSLKPDKIQQDNTMIDFCRQCKKCAEICPSKAISFNDEEEIDGITRWQINSESCFTFWCTVGTDCARCISVCPYSHPNNFIHNMFRLMIKKSYIFRKIAVPLDDFFYGRKPKTKKIPKWIKY